MTPEAKKLDTLASVVVTRMGEAFNKAPPANRREAITQVLHQYEEELADAMYAVWGGMTSTSGHSTTREECKRLAIETVTDMFQKKLTS